MPLLLDLKSTINVSIISKTDTSKERENRALFIKCLQLRFLFSLKYFKNKNDQFHLVTLLGSPSAV